MIDENNKLNIGLLSSVMTKPNIRPFTDLIQLLVPLSSKLTVIKVIGEELDIEIDKDMDIMEVKHNKGGNPLTQVFNYILSQFKMSYKIISHSNEIDLWIFFLGISLVVPTLLTRLRGKKIILIVGAAPDDIRSHNLLFRFVRAINLKLVNYIVLYSDELKKSWGLEKYDDKIFIAHRHYLDFNKFKVLKRITERKNLVGYVGRLSDEKGILNLIKSIPLLKDDNLMFLIYGEGELMDEIKKYIKENHIENVDLKGWIPNNEIPVHLNDLKLLVLPSYTEGLPNIMLESMACGTPVLATPVGAVPDVINDGFNGFIMENNSPEVIAENIKRVFRSSDLMTEIVKNGYDTVKKDFNYVDTLKRWDHVLKTASQ